MATFDGAVREVRFVDPEAAIDPAVRAELSRLVADFPAAAGPVEFIVQVLAAVPGRRFRAHAVAARREHARREECSLILVVALDDRHVELATAPRWAAQFDEAATAALLRRHFVPAMKAGDLRGALVATVAAIGRALGQAPARRPVGGLRRWLVPALLGLLAAVGFGVRQVQTHLCRQCHGWGEVTTIVLAEATYTSEGREEVYFHCPKCGAEYREVRTISVRSDSSSSSFDSSSDSGGGGDGGGGADW